MLIDISWRGVLAQAGAGLREDAGRAIVALGRFIERAGRRLAGHRVERELARAERIRRTRDELDELRRRAGLPPRRWP